MGDPDYVTTPTVALTQVRDFTILKEEATVIAKTDSGIFYKGFGFATLPDVLVFTEIV